MKIDNHKYITTKNIISSTNTEEKNDCLKIGYKDVDITVPVELRPDVDMGEIKVHYCGGPRIECLSEPCENALYIEIKQKAKIVMPVKFDVKATVKDSSIKCKDD